MVNSSTNINKTENYPSPQIIEHKIDYGILFILKLINSFILRETDGNAEIVVSLTDKIILTNNKVLLCFSSFPINYIVYRFSFQVHYTIIAFI